MLVDHELIKIKIKIKYLKLIPRQCTKHPTQPLNIGRDYCHSVFCLQCLDRENKCADGKSLHLGYFSCYFWNFGQFCTQIMGELDAWSFFYMIQIVGH